MTTLTDLANTMLRTLGFAELGETPKTSKDLFLDALTENMRWNDGTEEEIETAVKEMRESMEKEDAILAKLETSGFAERAERERAKIDEARRKATDELELVRKLHPSAYAEVIFGGKTMGGNCRTLPPMNGTQTDALRSVILAQKANAWVDKGGGMKVLMETKEDGSVEVVMPMGVASDTAGYNRNKAFQKERKTKAQARLRRKLAEKHDPHSGEECDRCFWEK